MMQIEEGKFYKNRNGDKVGPMSARPNYRGLYKWWDEWRISYRDDGGFLDVPSDVDLIEEWEEPATLPPATEADEGWGPWSGYVVCLEQSTDQTLVYHRPTGPGHLVYWVKKTGRLFRNNEDSPLGNIIGLANDTPPSLEEMLKECLE